MLKARVKKYGVELSPLAIVQAAEADLRKRFLKRQEVARVYNREGEKVDRSIMAERYAFRAEHVRQAEDVAHLLRLAISGFYSGQYLSAKRQTALIIYGDVRRLRKALKIVESKVLPSHV